MTSTRIIGERGKSTLDEKLKKLQEVMNAPVEEHAEEPLVDEEAREPENRREQHERPKTNINIEKSKLIFLPERAYDGCNSHPDLLISMEQLDWYNTWISIDNNLEETYMPTLRVFLDLLEGINKGVLYDGNKDRLSSLNRDLLEKIIIEENPGEWLDVNCIKSAAGTLAVQERRSRINTNGISLSNFDFNQVGRTHYHLSDTIVDFGLWIQTNSDHGLPEEHMVCAGGALVWKGLRVGSVMQFSSVRRNGPPELHLGCTDGPNRSCARVRVVKPYQ